MNNMTLVQLIELNRRAQGYPPSPVTLPDVKTLQLPEAKEINCGDRKEMKQQTELVNYEYVMAALHKLKEHYAKSGVK